MEKRQHKIPTKPFKAKIHFDDGQIWTYKVGARVIAIKSPDLMFTYIIPLDEFTGDPLAEKKSYLAHHRSQWQCLMEYGSEWEGITPSQIKTWIVKELKP